MGSIQGKIDIAEQLITPRGKQGEVGRIFERGCRFRIFVLCQHQLRQEIPTGVGRMNAERAPILRFGLRELSIRLQQLSEEQGEAGVMCEQGLGVSRCFEGIVVAPQHVVDRRRIGVEIVGLGAISRVG